MILRSAMTRRAAINELRLISCLRTCFKTEHFCGGGELALNDSIGFHALLNASQSIWMILSHFGENKQVSDGRTDVRTDEAMVGRMDIPSYRDLEPLLKKGQGSEVEYKAGEYQFNE